MTRRTDLGTQIVRGTQTKGQFTHPDHGMLRSVLPSIHWQPLIDLLASEDLAKISVDLAGVPDQALRVEVRGCLVCVSGHRPVPESAAKTRGLGYRFAEILYGSFERNVELPWEADPEGVRRTYRDGFLFLQVCRKGADRERA